MELLVQYNGNNNIKVLYLRIKVFEIFTVEAKYRTTDEDEVIL